MERAPSLEVRNLSVTRATRRVLDEVSVTVGAGEIVAVVGPNGSGKTTLLETIVGGLPASAGQVLVGGRPLRGLGERARWLGYLAAEAEPPLEARVRTLLDGVRPDIEWNRTLTERLGLRTLRDATIGSLSRGERRRVLLFEALAARNPFLLLDEPTGVFDPLQLLDVVQLLHQAAGQGTGMLVTVHQMSDAEALTSRILVLARGRVVALGAMAELRALAGVSGSASLHETFLALLRARQQGPEGGGEQGEA
jgi:ABC-type multidrug transport system ATPase subunit